MFRFYRPDVQPDLFGGRPGTVKLLRCPTLKP